MSVRSDNFAGERIDRLAQAGGQGRLYLVDRCVDVAVADKRVRLGCRIGSEFIGFVFFE